MSTKPELVAVPSTDWRSRAVAPFRDPDGNARMFQRRARGARGLTGLMHVEQVDLVCVPTPDVGRAVAFSRDVLGLAESEDADADVEAPNPTFAFWKSAADGEPFVANTAGVALRGPDVVAAVGEVRAAGAEVVGVEDTGVCHMGFVKDPGGNVLILHRRYAPKDRRGQA